MIISLAGAVLALCAAGTVAAESISGSDVLRAINLDAAPARDGVLLVCPSGTQFHKGGCGSDGDWTGAREYADGISPQAYLKQICPGARLVSVVPSFIYPSSRGSIYLSSRGSIIGKAPRSIAITFVGPCKSSDLSPDQGEHRE